MKNKNIVFTGGGSAGHVTPNLALIEKFQAEQWQVHYLGSKTGIEKDLVARENIPYYAISSGKLRRYFSWQNFIDPFKILLGIMQAYRYLRKLKPAVVFSKGGFVAFPVVIAAWLNRIPVIAHESDFSPGLANKLSFPFTKKVCLAFAEAKKFFKNQNNVLVTGTPIRSTLLNGDAVRGKAACGFNDDKKIILILGGGLGSANINQTIRAQLPQLLPSYNVIHLCGKGKIEPSYSDTAGYKQIAYANEELADLFACADLVISRAGANAINELITLKKPHILIPLSKNASRGDQIQNANYFAGQGLSTVIPEDQMQQVLLTAVEQVRANLTTIQQSLANYTKQDSSEVLYKLVTEVSLCTTKIQFRKK